MNIYLVRHGQTIYNALHRFADGSVDLDALGIKQVLDMLVETRKLPYEVIYCSPLLRARRTVSLLNETNVPVIEDNRLVERDPGDLEGMHYTEIDREEYWRYGSTIQYGTSETVESVKERVYSFIEDLKTCGYENVMVVGHSGVSKLFYTYFNGMPEDGKLLDIGLEHGEVRVYTI